MTLCGEKMNQVEHIRIIFWDLRVSVTIMVLILMAQDFVTPYANRKRNKILMYSILSSTFLEPLSHNTRLPNNRYLSNFASSGVMTANQIVTITGKMEQH